MFCKVGEIAVLKFIKEKSWDLNHFSDSSFFDALTTKFSQCCLKLKRIKKVYKSEFKQLQALITINTFKCTIAMSLDMFSCNCPK